MLSTLKCNQITFGCLYCFKSNNVPIVIEWDTGIPCCKKRRGVDIFCWRKEKLTILMSLIASGSYTTTTATTTNKIHCGFNSICQSKFLHETRIFSFFKGEHIFSSQEFKKCQTLKRPEADLPTKVKLSLKDVFFRIQSFVEKNSIDSFLIKRENSRS